MLPKIRLFLVLAQIIAVCLGDFIRKDLYEPYGTTTPNQTVSSSAKPYEATTPNQLVSSSAKPYKATTPNENTTSSAIPYEATTPNANTTSSAIPYEATTPKPNVNSSSAPPLPNMLPEPALPYQTISGCQVPELPTEVKYTGITGYEYSNKTGHWYKFHAGPVVNWTDARQACIDEGGDLAVPNSEAEAKVIMGFHARYFNKEIIDAERPDFVAVGIFWEDPTWKTVDGQLFKESGYSGGLKKYDGDHEYPYPYVVMNRGGKLAVTKSVLYPFICEKKNVRLEVTFKYY